MKTTIFSIILISLFNLTLAHAETKSLKTQFQTLGDNSEVVERVQKLDSRQKVRVVQNRMMDRTNRLELAANFGALSGGDAYVETKNLGLMLQYHLTPRWSFGLSYEKAYNQLNREGQIRYDNAFACAPNCTSTVPKVDFPLDTKLISVTFYPIYGKLNIFDMGITQFDLYTTLAYGQKTLNSGVSDVIAGSVGAGVWLNSFITARLEGRFETYHDLISSGDKRAQNAMSIIASLGSMLW